jgi:ribosome-associated translation inhibitor RaiA
MRSEGTDEQQGAAMSKVNVHTPGVSADFVISTSISTSGRVTEREQAHAIASLEAALHGITEPIRRCRVRLEHETDPHHVRRATARLSVDVDGTPIHAHADAETVGTAIDVAASRLHEQLRRRVDRLQESHRRAASSPDGEWRHGDERHEPKRFFDRPLDERKIERHMSLTPDRSTIEEAIFDLEALGFEFLLFVEAETDDDAVVWLDDQHPNTYAVQFAHGIASPLDNATMLGLPITADVEIESRPLPRLGIGAAQELLDLGGVSRVFFCDTDTDRGQVLHRRHDGHLGLVTLTT